LVFGIESSAAWVDSRNDALYDIVSAGYVYDYSGAERANTVSYMLLLSKPGEKTCFAERMTTLGEAVEFSVETRLDVMNLTQRVEPSP
jgi:hypothetical protein